MGSFSRPGGSRTGVHTSSSINKVLDSRLSSSRGILKNREQSQVRTPNANSAFQSPHSSGAKVGGSEITYDNSARWTNAKPETTNRLSNADGQTLKYTVHVTGDNFFLLY